MGYVSCVGDQRCLLDMEWSEGRIYIALAAYTYVLAL